MLFVGRKLSGEKHQNRVHARFVAAVSGMRPAVHGFTTSQFILDGLVKSPS